MTSQPFPPTPDARPHGDRTGRVAWRDTDPHHHRHDGAGRPPARQPDRPRSPRTAALTLSFRDLNGAEKIARLPRALTMKGVPAGDDPEIRDIGYYALTRNLVL